MPHHFLSLADHTPQNLRDLLALAAHVKLHPSRYREACRGRSLALIFEKPSLRTRVSFQTGIYQLGGQALSLGTEDIQLRKRETVADIARVLSRYVDGVVARVFDHSDLEEMAAHSRVPIINGLSDRLHPCQAMADLLTLQERHGTLEGKKIAYVGDGNNVAHSLLQGCAQLGVGIALAHPPGYGPDAAILAHARSLAEQSGATVLVTEDPREAVAEADAVYTDVWASMGREAERAVRLAAFQGYQVDAALMALARPGAIFLHCLPAHRGEEVSEEVLEGPASVVFDQAENRLHVQKAVLIQLLGR